MWYKIEEWKGRYYVYVKFWWFPFWMSEHLSVSLYAPSPFYSLDSAESYIERNYGDKPKLIKKGKL